VIIMGCDDSNMHEDKVSPLSFFVAMTRARESLHLITCLKARGTATATHIADLPMSHCEYFSYTKKGFTDLNSYDEFCNVIRKWNSAAEYGKKRGLLQKRKSIGK
jgi:hypothetical protein